MDKTNDRCEQMSVDFLVFTTNFCMQVLSKDALAEADDLAETLKKENDNLRKNSSTWILKKHRNMHTTT